MSSGRFKARLADAATYLILSVACVWALFPLYMVITTSFKVQSEAFSLPPKLFSFATTFEHYARVFTEGRFLSYYLNSAIVGIASVAVGLLVGAPAAYTLARFPFRGRRAISWLLLSPRAMPPIVLLLPFFVMWSELGLMDSKIGLTLVYLQLNLAVGVWMLREFFSDIPIEIEEAALVDGCSRTHAFLRVVLPLAAPGLAATAILLLIFSWNEFLFAFALTSQHARTAPVTVFSFVQVEEVLWGQLHAAGTLIVLPVVLFALLIQRHLVRGLTAGALR
jgi:multiple sugar transport system permease protein